MMSVRTLTCCVKSPWNPIKELSDLSELWAHYVAWEKAMVTGQMKQRHREKETDGLERLLAWEYAEWTE